MTKLERDALANFIRATSLKLEVKAQQAKTDPEGTLQDFLEIAAKLCEVADALEHPESGVSFEAFSEQPVSANETEQPESKTVIKISSKLH